MHALEQVAKEGAPPAGRREEERRTQLIMSDDEPVAIAGWCC